MKREENRRLREIAPPLFLEQTLTRLKLAAWNRKVFLARWRSCFLTGLAVTFPALLTLAAVKWLIGTISSVTDLLLFFLPRSLTHESLVTANDGKGEMFWYWSLVALALAVVLISGSRCAGALLHRQKND